jgi:hypothetical protein
MAYNQTNKMRTIKKVHEIVMENFIPGVTTYKGIWEKYVNPVYPCSYQTFLKYISTKVKKKDLEK